MNNLKTKVRIKSDFDYLNHHLGFGAHPPTGWQNIASLPLLIFVGVMGTGKTTVIKKLQNEISDLHVLPDRRLLTEKLLIAPQQREKNEEIRPLSRPERVPYIQKYKEKFPAGLAYAITQLYLDPSKTSMSIIFDGLRGKEEVEFAISALPKAQFVFLNVSELIRAQRMLERADPYDQRSLENKPNFKDMPNSFTALGIPEAKELFSAQDEENLWGFVYENKITTNELHNVLKLMLLEKSLYDKEAPRQVLLNTAKNRSLFIDTNINNAEEVTQIIKSQLEKAYI